VGQQRVVDQVSHAGAQVLRRFGAWPAWVLLGLFLIAPLAALVPEALEDRGAAVGRVLADPLFRGAVINTLLLGALTGALSTVVGVMVAIELARCPEGVRRWLIAALGLPLAFSGLVIAFGFILAFGRAGFVTQILAAIGADPARVGAWIYSVAGLGFAYAYYLVPRVALTLYPVFANLDARPLEAARTLGATPWRAFVDVVLREVAPSVVSTACLVSALAMGTYGTALALVGTQVNILPLMLLLKIGDSGADFAAAAVISLMLLAICSVVMGAGDVLARQSENRH
jgi:putative spermidine/putrescine transport system permease protein